YDLFNQFNEPGGWGGENDGSLQTAVERAKASFIQAMDDDLNTSAAIAALQGFRSDMIKIIDNGLSDQDRKNASREFRVLGNVLGLLQLDTWQFNPSVPFVGANVDSGMPISSQMSESAHGGQSNSIPTLSDSEVQARIAERSEAKKRKDFKRADAIREELKSRGITIEDKPDGTTRWKR
ncbi:MAG: cysteine--tRNA ligase, partial [Nitrospira sp.]|nr:cysteine--tRNA ligase [Nitrospira sp.]